MSDLNLTRILGRLQKGRPAEKDDIKTLLGLSDPYDLSRFIPASLDVGGLASALPKYYQAWIVDRQNALSRSSSRSSSWFSAKKEKIVC